MFVLIYAHYARLRITGSPATSDISPYSSSNPFTIALNFPRHPQKTQFLLFSPFFFPTTAVSTSGRTPTVAVPCTCSAHIPEGGRIATTNLIISHTTESVAQTFDFFPPTRATQLSFLFPYFTPFFLLRREQLPARWHTSSFAHTRPLKYRHRQTICFLFEIYETQKS